MLFKNKILTASYRTFLQQMTVFFWFGMIWVWLGEVREIFLQITAFIKQSTQRSDETGLKCYVSVILLITEGRIRRKGKFSAQRKPSVWSSGGWDKRKCHFRETPDLFGILRILWNIYTTACFSILCVDDLKYDGWDEKFTSGMTCNKSLYKSFCFCSFSEFKGVQMLKKMFVQCNITVCSLTCLLD